MCTQLLLCQPVLQAAAAWQAEAPSLGRHARQMLWCVHQTLSPWHPSHLPRQHRVLQACGWCYLEVLVHGLQGCLSQAHAHCAGTVLLQCLRADIRHRGKQGFEVIIAHQHLRRQATA